jgi:hypothetical protein
MKKVFTAFAASAALVFGGCETAHAVYEKEVAVSYAEGAKSNWAKPDFAVFEEDGRLWVFAKGDPAVREYKKNGELAKCVTAIGAGPEGRTVKSPDQKTIDAFRAAYGLK